MLNSERIYLQNAGALNNIQLNGWNTATRTPSHVPSGASASADDGDYESVAHDGRKDAEGTGGRTTN